jgi:hypothetical protein
MKKFIESWRKTFKVDAMIHEGGLKSPKYVVEWVLLALCAILGLVGSLGGNWGLVTLAFACLSLSLLLWASSATKFIEKQIKDS